MAGEPNTLRRLLVDSNGRFLKKDGGWTSDESEAMDFNDVAALLRACSKNRVRNGHILLHFARTPSLDVKIPLPQ